MALANHPSISIKTRRLVRQLAREMGYRIREGRIPPIDLTRKPEGINRVGLVFLKGSFRSSVDSATLMCMSTLAAGIDLAVETLCIEQVGNQRDLGKRVLKFAETLDGLILTGYVHDPVLDPLINEGVPFVVLGDPLSRKHIDIVTYDFEEAGRMATAHLLADGHRRIGFACEILVPGNANSRWHAGYRLAMADAGVPADPQLTLVTDLSPEGIQKGYEQLRSLPKPPDALVVPHPAVAAGIHAASLSAKAPMPMVCADLGMAPPNAPPPVATILVSFEAMCRLALKRLLEVCVNPAETPVRVEAPFETHGITTVVSPGDRQDASVTQSVKASETARSR